MIIKKFNFFFSSYLILVFVCAILYLNNKYSVGNDSTISEWLINYQGGYTRRGLLGELFIFLSLELDIKIRFIIFLFQCFFYTLYLYLLFYFIKDIQKNILIIFSIFSPLLIVYHIAEVEVLARKELVLFIHFLIYIIFCNSNLKRSVYLFISLPLVILIWEPVVFFFTFYILIYIYYADRRKLLKEFFSLFLSFLPSMIILLSLIFNTFTKVNEDLMCSKLLILVNERCYMSLGYLDTSIKDNFYSLFNDIKPHHIFRYTTALLIGFLPWLCMFLNIQHKKNINIITQKNFKLIFLLQSLPVCVLFMMGLDWGRWCNILYFYNLLSFLYFYKFGFFTIKKSNINSYKILKSKKFITFAFIIFAFSWNLKTLYKEDIGSLPLYRSIYKLTKIY